MINNKKSKKQNLKKEVESVVNTLSISSGEKKQFDVLQKSAVCIMLELYPDDTNYNYDEIIKHLIDYANNHNCMYAYIVHDKDKYDKTTYDNDHKLLGKKGNIKKPHCHFILCSNLQVPFIISDVFLGVTFPARFIKIIKPKDIDNVCLYLSHIKYSNKHQYSVDCIVTNRDDYIKGIHDDYHPNSAVNFVIKYLAGYTKHITFAKMWDIALNQNEIPFDDYVRCYNMIKDIVKEHNEKCRQDNIKQALNDQLDVKAKIEADSQLQKIYNIATTFGTSQIEINGKQFTISYYG